MNDGSNQFGLNQFQLGQGPSLNEGSLNGPLMTDHSFLMDHGIAGNLRRIAWSDLESPDAWTPTPTKPNQDFGWGIFTGALIGSTITALAILAVWPG